MSENISQALILVGGKASRLKRTGVVVDSTKAFLPLKGKPLLYWNLQLLHKAGIKKLVIAADHVYLLHKARHVVRTSPVHFTRIDYFQDQGLGVHGIPYELRYLLDDTFLFECGHSLHPPEHYRNLLRRGGRQPVVFTAFTPHPKNRRQPVRLAGNSVTHDPEGSAAIGHPIVGTQAYAKRLASLTFNIDTIIRTFSKNKLSYVVSGMPPEFDVEDEMTQAIASYEQLVVDIAIM